MLIDLAKVFPQSCSSNGINNIVINTRQITRLYVDSEMEDNAYYVVEVGKTQYRFLTTSIEDSMGMEELLGLHLSEITPDIYAGLIKMYSRKEKPSLYKLLDMCKENLEYYTKIFGIETTVPRLEN